LNSQESYLVDDSLIGRRLDEYRLEALLGQGSMARVYRGLDVRLKRWVALKVIDKPFRADQDYTTRFEWEAQAIAQLEHPHIVRVYRYGEANGLLYMVLQYIEGLALNQILASYHEQGEFIEPAEANRIIREVCSALDYAHSKGVIHRDVKPSNIILNQQGSAILVDFGLALLADIGTEDEAFGTPYYMAPEQVRSSFEVVPQSDLYAVGVILYEMCTGRVPFEAEEPLDVANLHINEPPPSPREFRPDLDPALEAVILRALAKKPEERYPTGRALANGLDRAWRIASAARSASPLPTLSHLSIPERVRVGLAEKPLPPLPAASGELPAELVETVPASIRLGLGQTGDRLEARPERRPSRGQASGTRRWPMYLGAGMGVLILVSVWIGLALLTTMIWQARGSVAAQEKNLAPLETSMPAPLPTATPTPSPSATPSPPPSATPQPTSIPTPQLAADTQRDFSDSQKEMWQYLWSEANKADFKAMKFKDRRYGTCWYAKDYVRICSDSGHPGNNEDIAWVWTSNFSGRIQALVSAHKIDRGGDGVTIVAYHNNEAIEELRLEAGDTRGVTGKTLFEADVEEGDHIAFVMRRNRRAEYDHTAFQAQIYRR
jgi:serine/threonine protein kinase